MQHPIIIISGATATGKTDLSIKLALEVKKQLNKKVVIINFDSLLFYKEINIGTAKPTKKQLNSVDHELINICSIHNKINAFDFITKANKIIKGHLENKNIIFLVGGGAFYLRALIKGMYSSKENSLEIIKEIEDLYKSKGINPLIEFLKKNDPLYLSGININDHYRIIRAVEYIKINNKKLSEQKKEFEKKDPYNFAENDHKNWNIYHIYLEIPKEQHLEIIRNRTSKIIEEGLIEEVSYLLKNNFNKSTKPLMSIGYKETILYLNGKIKNKKDLIEEIFISTRQLAKNQKTFFNKIFPKCTYNPLIAKEEITKNLIKFLQSTS